MLLSHGPGIFSFHWAHTSVWWVPGWQDLGTSTGLGWDADEVKVPPPCSVAGGFVPGTASPRHRQALVHNWLKIYWVWGEWEVIIWSLKTSGWSFLFKSKMGQNWYGAVSAKWNRDCPYPPSESCCLCSYSLGDQAKTGRYLAPMWQESNFWQARLHCLLAASTKQICQLLGQFCQSIILGVDTHTAWMHTPPSSGQLFLQSVHPSAIHYPKQDVRTWHRG